MTTHKKFIKGAASMYVVVIAALLFGIITVSFIRLIISGALRTTNDELAESAYNSALAGIEDARTALKLYFYDCKETATPSDTSQIDWSNSCSYLNYYISSALNGTLDIPNDEDNCHTIEQALQRNGDIGLDEGENHEVKVEHTIGAGSNTDQAYTCVTLNSRLTNYLSTLDSENTMRLVPLKYVSSTARDGITGIRIGWYDEETAVLSYPSSNDYRFAEDYSTPPTISVQLIQTGNTYTFDSFTETEGQNTNRGTVFLSPSARGSNNTTTHIEKEILLKSNNHTLGSDQPNNPVKVNCKNSQSDSNYNNSIYACEATIAFPNPIGANSPAERRRDTFYAVVSLPYGDPKTNFSIEMCTDADAKCTTTASFDDVQISIDSTGRASDMFSRVETRIETKNPAYPFAEFALNLYGGDVSINKNYYVTKNCWGDDCNNSGEAE